MAEVEVDQDHVAAAAGERDREVGDRGRLALALDGARDHDRLRGVARARRSRGCVLSIRYGSAWMRLRLVDHRQPVRRCAASAAAPESARGSAGRAGGTTPSALRTRVSSASRRNARPIPSTSPSTSPSTPLRTGFGWICAAPSAGLTSEAFEVWSASIVASCCSFSTRLA